MKEILINDVLDKLTLDKHRRTRYSGNEELEKSIIEYVNLIIEELLKEISESEEGEWMNLQKRK